MHIDVTAFLNSLPIMGKGMLGIFVVTLVMILGIYLLNRIFRPKKDKEKKD